MRTDDAAPAVSHDEWLEARLAHLAKEKEFTRQRDELSAERRRLPWLEIAANHRLIGPEGEVGLAELFGDRRQLLVYHFMMGPGWVEGCPSCSFWADNLDGIGVHLRHRDTALAMVSRAPLAEITAYKKRMGWAFPWYSSYGSSFNYDLGVSFTNQQVDSGEPAYNFGTQAPGEEMPGISALRRHDDGRIFLTYQTFARGLDMANGAYHLLDMTSQGRDEGDLEWSMAWLHRHDAYPG